MQKFLLGAAAVMAVAAPGVAAADTNAVVGLQYSNVDFDGFDFDNYGLTGGFSHDLSNGAILQMDGEMGRADVSGCCYALSYGAVHYGMRNDAYGVAGFVGLEDFFGYSGVGVGVEGQWFLPSGVVNGSLAYGDFGDVDLSGTNVNLDGAWFVMPNFAVTALVNYTEFDAGGSDFDSTMWGLGGEWRFDGTPFSIAAGYRNADSDSGDADVWTIGFNFDLGTDSLQDRSHSGPSFSGASAFHNALRTLVP